MIIIYYHQFPGVQSDHGSINNFKCLSLDWTTVKKLRLRDFSELQDAAGNTISADVGVLRSQVDSADNCT